VICPQSSLGDLRRSFLIKPSQALSQALEADSADSSAAGAGGQLQRPATADEKPKSNSLTDRSLPDSAATSGDESETSQPEHESHFWLRRGDQLFVGALLTAAFVLTICHWAYLSGWGLQPVEIERLPSHRFDFQLEINSATWVEWLQLKGIGDTLAHRIVEDREQNGPFESVDDLQRVKGIGPKTIERMRPWLRRETAVEDSSAIESLSD
jgi:competence protein ComEA